MSESMNDSSSSEVAKGLLQFLHDNFEEEFRSIAASNNIAVMKDKTMNAIQVEAMLQEVHVNCSDSHTLFRHLNQFFGGVSLFESEHTRHKTFAGQEFPSIPDVYKIPGKMQIDCWYEPPLGMLQHYAKFIFSRELLDGVTGIDIKVRGDHGKGRFQMMLKLVVKYLSSKKPFSETFQVANIDYRKNDITVIKDAVLQPTGKT
jgi:hypothetical protein